MLDSKQKLKSFLVALVTLIVVFVFGLNIEAQEITGKQLDLSAYIVNDENAEIPNGTYNVRFSIYTTDREAQDPYPSNSDSGSRVWEEEQEVQMVNGSFSVYLGSETVIPESLNFEDNQYYLGIRVNGDSEAIPRKRIGYVPLAMNANYLRGAKVGTEEGDILQLGNGGKIDIDMLPVGDGDNEILTGNSGVLHEQNTDEGTDSQIFNIGSDVASSGNNFDLTVSSDTNKPTIRFNGLTQAWQYSIDGISFTDIGVAAAGTITGIIDIANGGTGTGVQFTQGSIVFAGASGIYEEDNANFFWDNVNDRLGIGTTTPAQKLSVDGVVHSETGGFMFPDGTTQTSAALGVTYNDGGGLYNNYFLYPSVGSSITTGDDNYVWGRNAGEALTSGYNNIIIGEDAGDVMTTGNYNILIGDDAGGAITTEENNTLIGDNAGEFATSGNNTAVGSQAAGFLTIGGNNTLFGYRAGDNLTTGSNNIVIGYDIDSPTATNSNTLTIGNLIFGTGLDGTGTTVSSGAVGVGTNSPTVGSRLTVSGLVSQTGLGGSTYFGEDAGRVDDLSANNNTGFGYQALTASTTGYLNTTTGYLSLTSNTEGYFNTASGAYSLGTNSTGGFNTAMGYAALYSNETGDSNVAIGHQALYSNTGSDNIATGAHALQDNTIGSSNTAVGRGALHRNVDGDNNVSSGYNSLMLSTGDGNIAMGYQAADNLTAGSNNIFIGYDIDAPIATGSNQLNIGNLIFGTGIDGTGTTTSSGSIGIGTNSPNYKLEVADSGAATIAIDGGTPYFRMNASSSFGNDFYINNSGANTNFNYDGTNAISISSGGKVGIGELSPSAKLHLGAGTSLAGYAPLKLTAGTNLTTPEAGAIEFDGLNLYYTDSTLTRNTIFAGGSSSPSAIWDTDLDTGIEVERTADDDTIRFRTAGVQYFSMNGPRLSVNSSGFSVFIGGAGAGANDDLSNNANVGIGESALNSNVTGEQNTAVGVWALVNSLGSYNTAIGVRANPLGSSNVAIGRDSLYGGITSNTVAIGNGAGNGLNGANNILLGYQAGNNLTTGANNIVLGYDIDSPTATNNNTMTIGNLIFGTGLNGSGTAVSSGAVGIGTNSPTVGSRLTVNGLVSQIGLGESTYFGEGAGTNDDLATRENVGIGYRSLYSNTSGFRNVGIGNQTLDANTSGWANVATGHSSLHNNTSGRNNIAYGSFSLYSNTTGIHNTVIGHFAQYNGTGTTENIALGYQSLYSNSGHRNTALGIDTLYSNAGSNNIAIGYSTGSTSISGSNNMLIGYNVDIQSAADSNTLTIGNLIFGTGLDGAGTTISSGDIGVGVIPSNFKFEVAGHVGPSADDTYDLGSSSYRWRDLYLGPASLHIGTDGDEGVISYDTVNDEFVFNQELKTSGVLDVSGTMNFATTVAPGTPVVGDMYSSGTNLYFYNGSGWDDLNGGDPSFWVSGGNTATGALALDNVTPSGVYNTANGYQTLYDNTDGAYNTAVGAYSLENNIDGNFNTALGMHAGRFINGSGDNIAGTGNVFIGYRAVALNSGDQNEIVIGYNAIGAGSNSVVLGNDDISSTYLKGLTNISGQLRANGGMRLTGAFYDSNGEAGLAGQVLSTTGTETDWITVGGGSSFWTDAGADTYLTSLTDNVGIGLNNPSQKLHVSGNARITGFFYDSNNETGTPGQILSATATGTDWITNSGGSSLWTDTGADTYLTSLTDNIGIGTSAPAYKLDVAGVINTSSLIAQDLILSGNSASILKSYSGYTNFSGGIGTGGIDSINNSQRITSTGNLINIGSIQAGETNLTRAGTFAAKVDYATGSGAWTVSIGDLNGDGKSDLAVVGSPVSVFMNNGDGTFATKVDYIAGTSPRSISIGDLNGDGKADLAVTNYGSNSVSVFMNNGDGTFATKVDYATGINPWGVSVSDLDGDGKADLAVTNYGSDSISVFINNGDGTFAAKVDYTTGTEPRAVSVGDLNGDGKADLVMTNSTSDSVSVLLNNSDGTFATNVDYTTGTTAGGVSIGDLNGDGKADLAVTSYLSNSVSVFMNNGDGTFATKVDYTTGTMPHAVSMGDLNGDGNIDLATSNNTGKSVSTFINNGDGTFSAKVDYTTGVNGSGIDIGDLNGDGKSDLVAASSAYSFVSIFINQPQSMFYAQASTGRIGIGDLTPDHMLDVAGNIGLDASSYINFGDTDGITGYGFRDNAGTIEYKDSSGSWAAFGGGGGSGEWTVSGSDIYYNTGNVGIGTTTPEFALSLETPNSGILAVGEEGMGPSLSSSGAGTKFIWYPQKAAFRAGSVTGFDWDDIDIGSGSVAMGHDTYAGGADSFAMGNASRAGAYGAVGMGISAAAGGTGSVAMGAGVTAMADNSFAFGSGVWNGNPDSLMVGWSGMSSLFVHSAGISIGSENNMYALDVNGEPAAMGYTQFTNYSDQRLKKNINPLGVGYLDKIMQLNPSSFNYNELSGYDVETRSRTVNGFIAQELQTIFPEMVGQVNIGGTDYLDTNLSALPIYLTKAIQEQQVVIEGQGTSIDGVTLQTNQNITTLSGLQDSIDANLLTIENNLTDQDTRIISLEAELQAVDLDLMNTQIDELMNFMLAMETDMFVKLNALATGNILLDGKLEVTNIETGALTVRVVDSASATIGTATICSVDTYYDTALEACEIATDVDTDGIDDSSGEIISDGTKTIVKTTSVADNSKVFVTLKGDSKIVPLKVNNILAGESFEIEAGEVLIENAKIDWWIIEETVAAQ